MPSPSLHTNQRPSSAAGKSRSPTLVIAYLLWTFPAITPLNALALIRATRPFADPNRGFMAQLTLYHQMHCSTAPSTHPLYQHFLYERAVASSIACGRAPDAKSILFSKADDGDGEKEFRCRKCRRVVATSAHLVTHDPKEGKRCAHLFVEPLSWTKAELERGEMKGRLVCPNERCGVLVGKYAWQGMRCSCGEWVVPAISIARGRVDEGFRRGVAGKMWCYRLLGETWLLIYHWQSPVWKFACIWRSRCLCSFITATQVDRLNFKSSHRAPFTRHTAFGPRKSV